MSIPPDKASAGRRPRHCASIVLNVNAPGQKKKPPQNRAAFRQRDRGGPGLRQLWSPVDSSHQWLLMMFQDVPSDWTVIALLTKVGALNVMVGPPSPAATPSTLHR